MPNFKKPRTPCLWCGKDPYKATYKYCSNDCQRSYQSAQLIKKWKSGKVSGLNSLGLVSRYIKNYLRKKYNNKCCLCGWNRVNQKTGIVPLVADHIDGNWRNNIEENIRLICPNCDSLNPTYAGSNRGNGGRKRPSSKRAIAARLERVETN